MKSDMAHIIFGASHGLVPCDAKSCLNTLGTDVIQLTTLDNRDALIQECAGVALNQKELIRGKRYLLHGRPEHFEDDGPLWTRGFQQSQVWERMWRLLPDHEQGDWHLLERSLAEQIPQNKWGVLNLREIKPKEILKRFAEVGFEYLKNEEFTSQEREAVLIAAEDDGTIWKRLPFHETLYGDLCDIPGQDAYLESDLGLPEEYEGPAVIFRSSTNERVKGIQGRYLRSLTHEDLVQILISTSQPHRCWIYIIAALQQLTNLGALPNSLIRSIRTTKWLVDDRGEVVCPADVINLNLMENEVYRLVTQIKGGLLRPIVTW